MSRQYISLAFGKVFQITLTRIRRLQSAASAKKNSIQSRNFWTWTHSMSKSICLDSQVFASVRMESAKAQGPLKRCLHPTWRRKALLPPVRSESQQITCLFRATRTKQRMPSIQTNGISHVSYIWIAYICSRKEWFDTKEHLWVFV